MPLEMIRDAVGALSRLADEAEPQEFDHRIANSLQLIIRLLSLQAREATDAAVREALAAAVVRISAVAAVHRLVCPFEAGEVVEIGAYLRRLAAALEQSCPHRRICLEVQAARVPAPFAILLGLVLSEVVMNGCKSARHPAAKDLVRVCLAFPTPSRFRIEFQGDGWPPPDSAAGEPASLGVRIIDAMSRRLGGSYAYAPDEQGTRFVLYGAMAP
jgi:two-component sensor histidine kinase